MKKKYNYFILTIFIAIILFLIILATSFSNIEISNETNINKKDEIYKDMQTKTLTEMMYEATLQLEKGPGQRKEKIAYITIDDGPSKYTHEILDILDANNVKATFFMIDENMKERPDEVKRITEENHGVGFHSVSHDISILYQTPEITLKEFDTCNETYESITGRESKIIRPPYGSKPYMPKESYEILIDNNYLIWDWNLDTEDWKGTTDNIISNVLYYGRDKQELVILLHEKEQSVKALDSIIKILKERGYEIMPITQNITPHNYWNANL